MWDCALASLAPQSGIAAVRTGLVKNVSLVIDVLLVLGAKDDAVPARGVTVPMEVAVDADGTPNVRSNMELLCRSVDIPTIGKRDMHTAPVTK